MASPAPSIALEAPRERAEKSYKMATPSKSGRSDSVSTTGRRRSRSHRDSMHMDYQAQRPRASATPQPLPLVLLHVTILPMQMPYTPEVMIKIMPEWLVENYKVLEEKLQDIVLMRRGLLIQHPRDEYDVLEERILESLELKTPRLLPCGHFVAPELDDEDAPGCDEEHTHAADNETGRGSRMSGGTVTAEEDPELRYPTPNSEDVGVCMDCHRQVKKPGHGVGAGSKKWDMKIYAANGLMRAGAWEAAWSEMERCDVEITPWIPHEVRKTLDKRLEQEQEKAKAKALYAAELKRHMEDEEASQRKLKEEAEAQRRADETELQIKTEAEAVMLQRKLDEEAAEKKKLEETLTEKIEEAKEAIRVEFESQALLESNGVADRFRALEEALKAERAKATAQLPPVLQVPHIVSRSRSRSQNRNRSRSRRPRVEEIPLGTLLKNYFVVQLQDSRNMFILILGALVVFLLTNSNPNWNLPPPTMDLATDVSLMHIAESVVPAVITTTATMTATSVSTLVITEVQTVNSPQETTPLSSFDATMAEEAVSKSLPSPKDESAGIEDVYESAEIASVILAELAEQVISEQGAAPLNDEPVSPGEISESVESTGSIAATDPVSSSDAIEVPKGPIDEATTPEKFATEEPVDEVPTAEASITLETKGEELDAEVPIAEETPAEALLSGGLIDEQPMAADETSMDEPEEIIEPLESALPEADSVVVEEIAGAETLEKSTPEPGIVQLDEDLVRSEDDDASSAARDRDEL